MSDIQNYTELTGFRYERKYTVETLSYQNVEQTVRNNSLGFTEIFHQRHINNIYFDTPRLDFYYDNSVGRRDRVKYRIRWYGDFFGKVNQPILELKIKNGPVGTKRSFKLSPFEVSENTNFNIFPDILKKSNLPEDVYNIIKNLEPSVVNRYKRKYFRSFSRDYRITIDRDVSYSPAFRKKSFNKAVKDLKSVIVELKYDEELNFSATEITNDLPFRLTKNSKYVNGIELFYNVID